MPSALQVDNIKDGSATKTLAEYSSSAWSWGEGTPAGTVLQVQMTSTALAGTQTTSTTFVTTGISVTITPKFNDSKMLITWSTGSTHINIGNGHHRGVFTIYKDSGSGASEISNAETPFYFTSGSVVGYFNQISQASDTVSNTNLTTYYLYTRSTLNTFYYINPYSGTTVDCNMSVMEIKQ